MSTFGHAEKVRLGSCKLIEEVMIGEDKLIRFSGRDCITLSMTVAMPHTRGHTRTHTPTTYKHAHM